MKNLLALLLFLLLVAPAAAQQAEIYIDDSQAEGFGVYLTAAFQKKKVPATVTLNPEEATYILRTSAIEVEKESGAGKIARCLFAYCVGIEDKANISVQLISHDSQAVLWAYSVNKGRGKKNNQSMAEAVAKHLKKFLAKR